MMLRPRSSIGLKITVLVLCGASTVLALALSYSYSYSRTLILDEAERTARNLTLSVARRIEQDFRAAAKVPGALVAVMETGHLDKEAMLNLIRRLVEDSREVYGVTVAFEPHMFEKNLHWFAPYYYKNKSTIIFEQLGSDSYDYFTKDWYYVPKMLKAPVWTEPYFDEGGGGIEMVTCAYPFFERGTVGSASKVKGIVTADVSLDWLTGIVSSVRPARTGYCFVVSDTGRFVSHPDANLIMCESMFSIAEERHDPALRSLGKGMKKGDSGFAEIGPALSGYDAFLAFARIPTPGWSLGAVFSKKELLTEINNLHRRTLMLAAVGVGLLLAVSLWVARSLSRPLQEMARATERVAKGDLDIDISGLGGADEVGQLAVAFGRMVEGLKQRDFIRDAFGRYLAKEVVNRLLESEGGLTLGGEARELTLRMSDLRGFTMLTSNMAPEAIIVFLNRYLGKMVEILVEYGGIIDEIMGDGILAFFGAPEPLEDHAARAVACALKMQAAMEEINLLNETDGLPHLEMGVAVHTGTVVVGNIGSEKRSKYGAVGLDVNLTGRMESFAIGGQVLVSQATYDRISDMLSVKQVMQVQMKGIRGTVNLYDIRGIAGPFEVSLPEKHEAPQPWQCPMKVIVSQLHEKIITATALEGLITHSNETSAVIVMPKKLEHWEDVRIEPKTGASDFTEGEAYAKVV